MASKKKPDGYWKKRENLVTAVQAIMAEQAYDALPNGAKLAAEGYSSIAYAIQTHHGGFQAFRESIGEELSRKARKAWQSLDFVLERTQAILVAEKMSELPSREVLCERGHRDYVAGVTRYHGGLQKIRELLGHKQLIGKRGAWRDEAFIMQEARRVMQVLGLSRLPSTIVLHQAGYSALGASIVRYHGGMPKFRAKLEGKSGEASRREGVESLLTEYVGDAHE